MTFKQKLEGQEAEEGTSVTLQCEISKPGAFVEWKKGTQVLKSGEKYQLKQKASVNELLINKVVVEDSGDYSCVCGDQTTTANLSVKGRRICFKLLQCNTMCFACISFFCGVSFLFLFSLPEIYCSHLILKTAFITLLSPSLRFFCCLFCLMKCLHSLSVSDIRFIKCFFYTV